MFGYVNIYFYLISLWTILVRTLRNIPYERPIIVLVGITNFILVCSSEKISISKNLLFDVQDISVHKFIEKLKIMKS